MEPKSRIDDGKEEVEASEYIKNKENQPQKDLPSLELLISYNEEILRKLKGLEEKSAPRAHIRL